MYNESCALFCSLQSNVPGTFSNVTHQGEIDGNRNCPPGQPSG